MRQEHISEYCILDSESENLLKNAFIKLKMSARAYNRILKVSRTIADLEGVEKIMSKHVSEAVQYRSADRMI